MVIFLDKIANNSLNEHFMVYLASKTFGEKSGICQKCPNFFVFFVVSWSCESIFINQKSFQGLSDGGQSFAISKFLSEPKMGFDLVPFRAVQSTLNQNIFSNGLNIWKQEKISLFPSKFHTISILGSYLDFYLNLLLIFLATPVYGSILLIFNRNLFYLLS